MSVDALVREVAELKRWPLRRVRAMVFQMSGAVDQGAAVPLLGLGQMAEMLGAAKRIEAVLVRE